jgi:prepilin-type N-terminal cleavage/methylation domain-containing protein
MAGRPRPVAGPLGFSLVELAVVMSVIAVTGSVVYSGMAGYRRFAMQQRMISETTKLATAAAGALARQSGVEIFYNPAESSMLEVQEGTQYSATDDIAVARTVDAFTKTLDKTSTALLPSSAVNPYGSNYIVYLRDRAVTIASCAPSPIDVANMHCDPTTAAVIRCPAGAICISSSAPVFPTEFSRLAFRYKYLYRGINRPVAETR